MFGEGDEERERRWISLVATASSSSSAAASSSGPPLSPTLPVGDTAKMFTLFPQELQRLTEAVVTAGSSRKGNFQKEGENFSTSINSSSDSGGNDNDTGFMTGSGAGSGTGAADGKGVDAASTNEIFQRALEEGGRVVYGVKHDVDLASSSSQGFEEIARKHRTIAVQVGHYHITTIHHCPLPLTQ